SYLLMQLPKLQTERCGCRALRPCRGHGDERRPHTVLLHVSTRFFTTRSRFATTVSGCTSFYQEPLDINARDAILGTVVSSPLMPAHTGMIRTMSGIFE